MPLKHVQKKHVFLTFVFNLTHCFSLEKEDMVQKIRVFNKNELEIRVVIFLCLILSIVMSLLASCKPVVGADRAFQAPVFAS